MANPHEGEVSAVINGRERTIKFSARALAAIEGDMGKPIGTVLTMIGEGSIQGMVAVLRRAVTPALTENEAFDTLDSGDITELSPLIGEALARSGMFTGTVSENPPKATA